MTVSLRPHYSRMWLGFRDDPPDDPLTIYVQKDAPMLPSSGLRRRDAGGSVPLTL